MKSYIYNRTTGEYCKESECIVGKDGVPIISAYETIDAPPAVSDNQVARYLDTDKNVPSNHGANGASWVIQESYIGTTYYNQDGTVSTIIDYDVSVPEGCITEAPENEYYDTHDGTSWIYNYEKHRENRVSEVKALEGSKYNEYFTHSVNGVEYKWQVDKDSQSKLRTGACIATMSIVDPVAFPWEGEKVSWKNLLNEMIAFDSALEYLKFTDAVYTHCRNIWAKAGEHKAALRATELETEIKNYDITQGW